MGFRTFFALTLIASAAHADVTSTIATLLSERLGAPVHLTGASATWPPSASGIVVEDGHGKPRLTVAGAQLIGVFPPVLAVQGLDLALAGTQGPRLVVPAGQLDGAATGLALSAPSASLSGPYALDLKDLKAAFASGAAGMAISHFEAHVYGGLASGSLTPSANGPPHAELTIKGLALSAVTGHRGGEKLDATLSIAVGERLEDLSGSGHATLSGLTTDLTHDPTLASMDAQVREGARSSEMVGALGGLIRDEKLRGLAGTITSSMGAGQVEYYRGIIRGLRRVHSLGEVTGPLSISKGSALLSPFSGPLVAGRLKVNLVTRHLSGHLSRCKLGRVTLQDVNIAGTLADPSYSVNRNRVLVDGHGVPSPSRAPAVPRVPNVLRTILGSGLLGR